MSAGRPPGWRRRDAWLAAALAPLWAGPAATLFAPASALRPEGVAWAGALGFSLLALVPVAGALAVARVGARALSGPGGASRRSTRWAALLSVGIAGVWALLGAATALQTAELRQPRLGAWALTGGVIALSLVGAGAVGLLEQGLLRLRERSPMGATAASGVLATGSLVAGATLAMVELGPAWVALGGAHHLAALVVALVAAFADAWVPALAHRVLWLSTLVAVVLGSGAGVLLLREPGSARAALLVAPAPAAWVPRALLLLGDRDGDGHAAWLGGGDCDDGDPGRHPGALELLANGIDEDCDGADPTEDPTVGTLDGRLRGPGCATDFALPPATNVLLMVVDAARADRLEPAPRDVMPTLRGLAAEGLHLTRCYSPHPSTAYALPALFTGLDTRWARDLARSQRADIPPGRALIQTELARFGYRSAAVYGHFLAGHRHAMTRGMTATRLRTEPINSRGVADDALSLVDEIGAAGQPFFVYAHFYDPHWPYETYPEGHAPWGQASHLDRYDHELRNADDAIALVLGGLEERGLIERTLVVVVSDHGEEHGEHGGRFHGQTVYEEVVRVPCVLRVPGMAARRVAQPVSLVDMFPTVLDLLGMATEAPMQGVSLEPLLLGQTCERGPVVGEMQPWTESPPFKPWLFYLVDGSTKVIFDVQANRYELYDLAADEGEQHDLASEAERLGPWRDALHHQVMRGILLPPGSQAHQRLRFP